MGCIPGWYFSSLPYDPSENKCCLAECLSGFAQLGLWYTFETALHQKTPVHVGLAVGSLLHENNTQMPYSWAVCDNSNLYRAWESQTGWSGI